VEWLVRIFYACQIPNKIGNKAQWFQRISSDTSDAIAIFWALWVKQKQKNVR